jgi:uncharacterized protein YlxW (UPF0749 family)
MSDTSPRLPPTGDTTTRPAGARLTLGVAIALLAGVLVLANQSQPVVEDARVGRRVELVELIHAEQARVDALATRVEELSAQVIGLQSTHADDVEAVGVLRAQVDDMALGTGLTPVRGPGLQVELTDSPMRTSPSGDLNDLVIHEQDLQAVINALWAGGAEAMTVQGQRVLATTAIRCVGNTLLLHGRVYSPPYIIEAIGEPEALETALARDVMVERFRRSVKDFQLGFSVVASEQLELPGSEGLSALQVARPAASARS